MLSLPFTKDKSLGFKRIVLGREISINEIKRIKDSVPDMELEAFCHGAMCIAYAGRCLMSAYLTGRSAQAGACSHTCRWEYDVLSKPNGAKELAQSGRLYLREHERPEDLFPVFEGEDFTAILSSKDLCMIDHLEDLKNAGVDSLKISQMVGHMLPPLTIFVPFFLMFLMDGFKGVKETFPAILVAALSFAITQFITAVYVGPELPDITSAIVSLACTTVFLRFWQPKNIFTFDGVTPEVSSKKYSFKEIVYAWSPFLVLIVTIVLWTQGWFKALFTGDGH